MPTFPNATYLFVDDEYRRWDTANPDRHPNTFNPNVFDECVRPVVEVGQAQLISIPYQVSESLTIEAAPGHTVGHSLLRLVSSGAKAYFTGDAFHHPVQMTRPDSHLPGCDNLDAAIKTRKLLIQRILEEGAFIFPAHFPDPHYGRLATRRRRGSLRTRWRYRRRSEIITRTAWPAGRWPELHKILKAVSAFLAREPDPRLGLSCLSRRIGTAPPRIWPARSSRSA